MKIHTLLSPHNVDDLFFTGKTTVVIDVLRATTVIATAVKNGAREVIPVGTIEFAVKISGNAFGGYTLLGGERNTKKIDGFNLGNSPFEYTEETVSGKSIILFTTNGSKAIVKAKFSENLFMCCLNNLKSIAGHLLNIDKDVVILCSGSHGMFCIEDTVCAGILASEIRKRKPDVEFTDAVKASIVLSEHYEHDLINLLTECEHGKLLTANGYERDIEYCARLNNLDVIPFFSSGVIKLAVRQE